MKSESRRSSNLSGDDDAAENKEDALDRPPRSQKSEGSRQATPAKSGEESHNSGASNSDNNDAQRFGDDEAASDVEQEASNQNIVEKFRLAMKQSTLLGPPLQQNFGPPPEDLIEKSAQD